MSLKSFFKISSNNGYHDLRAFEQHLRTLFSRALDDALATGYTLSPAHRDLINDLQEIFNNPQAEEHLQFCYEKVMPLSSKLHDESFSEALLRLVDAKGETVAAPKIFDALDSMDNGNRLSKHFRLWLCFAQMLDFYQRNAPEKRLSFNVSPDDLDPVKTGDPDFAALLEEGIDIAVGSGLTGLVLEAVETAPWTDERLKALERLAAKPITVALDDFGAPDGNNEINTLNKLLLATARQKLIIKLDGALVRSFMDDDDPALVNTLRHIHSLRPDTLIVAEWIADADEAKTLIEKLRHHGVSDEVHLVQGRTLAGSIRSFIDSLRPSADGGGAPTWQPSYS